MRLVIKHFRFLTTDVVLNRLVVMEARDSV
ncbi:Uncharacterised protein [Vibrio cholerae]|nr:Uncharacterised protein [Vibrio cholerae]